MSDPTQPTQPQAPSRSAAPESVARFTFPPLYELGKDLLVLAVVPLVLWIISLSVDNALQGERIEVLQSQVQSFKLETLRVDKLREDLQALAVHQVRVEGKVDAANGRLDELKVLLAR